MSSNPWLLVKNESETSFVPPFSSLPACIDHWAMIHPHQNAIETAPLDGSTPWSCPYGRLLEFLGGISETLRSRKIQAGDSIGIAYENEPEVLLLSWTAWSMGIRTVPLDLRRDDADALRYKLHLSDALIVFTSMRDLKMRQHRIIRFQVSDIAPTPFLPTSSSLDSDALILFTSGTTAKPKGARLTIGNLMANADGIAAWLAINERDRFLIILPLHHINSTTMCLATLLRGGTIVLQSRYSNSQFWDVARETEATLTSVVPTIIHDQLAQIQDRPLETALSRIQIGSAPVQPQEAEEFVKKTKIPLIQGYGQTETALRSTGVVWNPDRPRWEPYWRDLGSNTIGEEMKWTNVTVLTKEGKEGLEGQEGEICVRGPVIMKEYLKNPVETKKAFEYGWFHSGDLGFWQKVGPQKQFFIRGRLKEVIIKAGVNVSPLFVEHALKKSLLEIDQVYVIGIPDERVGEEVGAVVVWKQWKFRKLPQKVKGLSKFETPGFWFSVEAHDLPMTSTGKVQRVKLKQMFADCAAIAETKEHVFRRLATVETDLIEQARRIHNVGWKPLVSAKREWRWGLEGKFLISAIKKTDGELVGYIRCRPQGGMIEADALTVAGRKKFKVDSPETLPQPTVKDVEMYLANNLDPVIKFHQRPKAGLKTGAKILKIVSRARPGDSAALGFGVLMEYPRLQRENPMVTIGASLGQQLVEAALTDAKNRGIHVVRVLSRPVGLAHWVLERI